MERPTKPNRRQILTAMLSHAARHSPYYREQEWAARLRQRQNFAFSEIPVTSNALVKAETERFFSAVVPESHGKIHTKFTSGSTGEPMQVRKTDRHFRFNALENLRLKAGWGYELHRRTLHVVSPGEDRPMGQVEEKVDESGARTWQIASLDTSAVFDLLERSDASLLVAFPSIALGVLERAEKLEAPSLRLVSTYSEVVPRELLQLVRRIPDCRLTDLYGCIETGAIAAQCPLCGRYHVADRHLALEILAENGRQARPGEMGRVIATPLFNRAMPLLRYDTGDYAVVAESKDCPRSPHAIERIVGREKNLFKLPGGRKVTPMLPAGIADGLAIRQFKLVQTTLADVELRYIPRGDGAEITQDLAQALVDKYLSPGFRVRAVRVTEIPRAPGGKFLMHESLV